MSTDPEAESSDSPTRRPTDDTQRVVGRRRLDTLLRLGKRQSEEVSAAAVCRSAAAALAGNPHDFPFALLYLLADDAAVARLVEAVHLPGGSPAAPASISVGGPEDRWGLLGALENRRGHIVDDLDAKFGRLSAGPWDDDVPTRAFAVPLVESEAGEAPLGVLIAGIGLRSSIDENYRRFVDLVASQIAANIRSARAYQDERERLKASERKFSIAFDRSPLVLTITSLDDGRLVEVNETFVEVTGYSRDESIGRRPDDLGLWLEPRQRAERFERLRAGDRVPDVEARFRLRSGEERVGIVGSAVVEIDGRRCVLSSILDITARKRAEDAQRRWEYIFNHAGWAVAAANPDTNLLELANPAFAAMHGYTVEEMIGMPLADTFAPADRQRFQELVAVVHAQGDNVYESRHLRKDGSTFPVLTHVSALKNEEGRVLLRAATFQDITERKRTEEALRESEARKTAMFEAALDGLVTMDHRGTIVDFNAAAERTFGHRREEVVGRDLADLLIPAALRERHRRGLARYLETGETRVLNRRIEMTALRADGSEVPVELTVTRVPTAGPALFTAYLRDIADRKRADDALHQSEERLRLAMSAGRVGVWDWDIAANQVTWSDSLYAIHGLEPGTFGGTVEAFAALVHPDDRASVNEAIQRGLQENAPYSLEFRAVRPDGGVVWIDTQAAVIRDASGRPLRMLGGTVDVTARKRVEQALRESEERFRLMADAAPVLIWTSGSHRERTWFNRQWLDFVGRAIDQELGDGWTDNVHPDDRDRCLSTYAAFFEARRPFSMEYRLRRHDGAYRWVLDNGRPFHGAHGEFTGYIGSCLDITERRQTEADLRDANRMKDEFLATLSHELRTPLNAVLGWTHMLRTGSLRREVAARAFESLERNAKAQTQLVDDLLDVSRIVSGKLLLKHEAVELAAIVARSVDTVRSTALSKGVELTIGIEPPGRFEVTADADRLQQIVWNLLSNAIKFTTRGGQVQVALRRAGTCARVVVRDTGEGIDPEFLPFVFDRFRQADSTTARRHGGLGLGLAIVRHLTEAHGGTVTAESDGKGRGATFTVELPLAAARARPPLRRTQVRAAALLKGARVLVVDDEVDARELLRVLLGSRGAEVTAVGSAGEALHAIQEGKFHVLVADIGMPEQDGLWLARAIRDLPPPLGRIPAIALTAYVNRRERERALEAGYDLHLPKPVEPDQLVAAVAGALRRSGSRTFAPTRRAGQKARATPKTRRRERAPKLRRGTKQRG